MSTGWVEVYTRCMDGEFFRGAYCPKDGHSNPASLAVARIVEESRANATPLSFDALLAGGFDGDLADVMVVQFADPRHAPE